MQVFLLAAVSLDGFIAQSDDLPSTKWTSSEDTAYFKKRTKELRICVMGRTTFETIGHGLPERAIIVMSRSGSSLSHLPELADKNGSEIVADGGVWWTKLQPNELLASLEKGGQKSLAVCGGSSIYTQFMDADLVDKVELTVEQALLKTGKRLFVQAWEKSELKLREIWPLSDKTQVFKYDVKA